MYEEGTDTSQITYSHGWLIRLIIILLEVQHRIWPPAPAHKIILLSLEDLNKNCPRRLKIKEEYWNFILLLFCKKKKKQTQKTKPKTCSKFFHSCIVYLINNFCICFSCVRQIGNILCCCKLYTLVTCHSVSLENSFWQIVKSASRRLCMCLDFVHWGVVFCLVFLQVETKMRCKSWECEEVCSQQRNVDKKQIQITSIVLGSILGTFCFV